MLPVARLTIAGVSTSATRISYMGELGREIDVASSGAPRLFDATRKAGAPFGLRLVGMHAVDCLWIEKGLFPLGP